MKHIAPIHALLAVFSLAVPAIGLSAPDGHDQPGRHYHAGYHGHYYHRGPRVFFGASPAFWGPGIGFSFYGSPGYYSPGYYNDDAPDRPTYRGVAHPEADGKDDLGVDVQRSLSEQGYYRGAIDGDIGAGSRSAIRAYQSDHGLEVTGRIDNALLHSLRID